MKLLLVVPPFTDATQPGAAVPCLAAAVQGLDVEVQAWDLNLDAWDYLLDEGRQRRWLRLAQRRIRQLDRRPRLGRAERAQYRALADGVLRGAGALEHLGQAADVMHSRAFFDARKYLRSIHAVDGAFSLVSAVFHPARLQWGRYWPARPLASSVDVAREASAPATNPFVELTRVVFGPRLAASAPDVIGISVTYLDQVVPALTLAAECRRRLPGATIVLGGQIVSAWGDDLARADALWRLVDVCVLHEGESALRGLLGCLATHKPFDDVPNLMFRRNGVPVRTPQLREEHASLPAPDYSVLPVARYWSPQPVLTVSASRGCYWGRCAFCAVSPAFRGAFTCRPTARVARDMAALMARHGCHLFTFGDDALPRELVRDLATPGVLPEGVSWQAELRWDAIAAPATIQHLARAGATNLVFGLESGSQEVLRRMRKGASVQRARTIIRGCDAAGIGVNLQCFLGFPGETVQQAGETFDFLQRVAGQRTTVSCGIFELQKGSPIARTPEEFGIRISRAPSCHDLALRFEYQPRPAAALRQRLVERLAEMAQDRAPQLRCGVNAHTLIYLAHTRGGARPGVVETDRGQVPRTDPDRVLKVAPGAAWHVFGWDPASLNPGGRPRRGPCGFGYTVEHGRTLALGPVTTALMAYAQDVTPTYALMQPLSREERRRVRRALQLLGSEGLLATNTPRSNTGQ